MSAFISPQLALEQKEAPPAAVQKHHSLAATPPLMEAPKSPIPARPIIPDILKRIAYCESRNRQFNEKGNVLRGVVNKADVGKYQINTTAWGEEAKKFGFDLHTEDGNEQMALALYKRYGTSPWSYSAACWD